MKLKSGGRARGLGIGALASVLWSAAPGAAEAVDGLALAFDRFMRDSQPVCQQQPADACIELAWRFADADDDRGLSVAELAAVRAALEGWVLRHQGDLSQPERSGLVLGFLIVDSIGVERLHALYDGDRDGLVSRQELVADLRLDRRPLGEVLLDPAAVDRPGLARRLGIPPALIERIQP